VTRPQILEKLTDILANLSAQVPAAEIGPTTRLISELQIDSLKVAELSLMLEDGFGLILFLPDLLLSVPDPHELTVASLVDFVAGHLPAAAASGA
jgi:acyl carrier protein